MEHHAPHPDAAFEGYYNKFELPSGAHLVLIICQVKKAKSKPNLLSFTYVPRDSTSKLFQRELFPSSIDMRRDGENGHAFTLGIPNNGHATWDNSSCTEYDLENEHFSFHATTTTRTPWNETSQTPEDLLVVLPLPLHWHVQSLASRCKFTLHIPGYDLPSVDQSGAAYVHQEKNWAYSFPSAHMWVQCRDGERSFCCAGGKILGMEAFLLGYRSEDLNLDFRPPLATRILGIGPFMTYKSDWENRSFELSVQSFREKITVQASAPKGSFFPLSPPFPDGHRDNFLTQSFQTEVKVKIYESGWFSPWRLIREDTFERGSLEFGGAFYPLAGSADRFN